jgi:hypothetical protein
MDQDRRDDLRRRLADPAPVFVDLGTGLGRLEVWSQARWEATDEGDRPAKAEYFEGLGWVVAIPVHDAN